MEYEFENFSSEYLCSECGGLLYVNHNDTSQELCINQLCERCPSGVRFIDPSSDGSPQLYRELAEAEAGLFAEIRRCDAQALSFYAYGIRKTLIDAALTHRVMPSIPTWFAAGELLLLITALLPKGTENDLVLFHTIFKKTAERTDRLNFIEDLENERYKILTSPGGKWTVFMIKYLPAIREAQKDYGLASSATLRDASELFQFEDIRELVTNNVELGPGVDLADFFNTLWPYILTLRYALSSYYRTSQQYDYSPDRIDIPAILSLLYCLPQKEAALYTMESLQKHFTQYEEYSGGGWTFAQFLAKYVDNTRNVPIIVRAGDKLITDPSTLLYFAVHLHGQYIDPDERRKAGGNLSIARLKQQAADAFEAKVREEIHKRGYSGPQKAVKVRRFEYDVLGISERKKRIIIVDAKFRDLAPSSISGRNLIKQELLQPRQGLQSEAERHKERVDFFRSNPELFRKHLNPRSSWHEYEIGSYLVTKHAPLVSRYKDVGIFSISDFLEFELERLD